MEKPKKNEKGITLIALVISIIVMLILSGIALNSIIGENGVLEKAQMASISQRFSNYKEEFQMNSVEKIKNGQENEQKITAINDNVKKYITSLSEKDASNFCIISGEIYYLGNDQLERKVAEQQGFLLLNNSESLEEFDTELERKAFESVVSNSNGNTIKQEKQDGSVEEVGIKLYDKNLENANKWKIITEIENEELTYTYGSNWYYVEKGTEITDIGILESDYIINYQEKKVIKFVPEKHTILSFGANLAVSDSLIFNIDPAIIEDAKSGDTSWKNGIQVYGYESNYSDTFSDIGMKFDGEDDYIKIPGNLGKVGAEGLTFEFFGVPLNRGFRMLDVTDEEVNEDGSIPIMGESSEYIDTIISNNGRTYQKYTSWVTGILGLGKEDHDIPNLIKFLLRDDSINETLLDNQIGNLYFNYGYGFKFLIPKLDEEGNKILDENGKEILVSAKDTLTPWSANLWVNSPTDLWNQTINTSNYNLNMYYGNEIYYAIVLNPKKDTQSIYLNGELIDEVQLNTNAWRNLQEDIEKNGNDGYWLLGRCTEGVGNSYRTFNGEIYTARVYERVLNSEEIKANYNATISYHNILNNNTSTDTESGE